MGGFSIWHWSIMLLFSVFWVMPLYRILDRIGMAPAWAFTAVIPMGTPILLWVIAYSKWDQGESIERIREVFGDGPTFRGADRLPSRE